MRQATEIPHSSRGPTDIRNENLPRHKSEALLVYQLLGLVSIVGLNIVIFRG